MKWSRIYSGPTARTFSIYSCYFKCLNDPDCCGITYYDLNPTDAYTFDNCFLMNTLSSYFTYPGPGPLIDDRQILVKNFVKEDQKLANTSMLSYYDYLNHNQDFLRLCYLLCLQDERCLAISYTYEGDSWYVCYLIDNTSASVEDENFVTYVVNKSTEETIETTFIPQTTLPLTFTYTYAISATSPCLTEISNMFSLLVLISFIVFFNFQFNIALYFIYINSS